MDWSEKILEQSKKTLMRFKKVTSKYQVRKNEKNITKDKNMKDFLDALYDDLNTPKALAIINGWFDKLKKKQLPDELLVQLINKSFDILGINLLDENSFNNFIDEDKKNNIERMIEERKIARQNKDFKKADQIREELKKMNVLIDDTNDGTKWTVNDK